MEPKEILLNPFVYISETDIRFYMLVFTSILTAIYWGFVSWIIFSFAFATLEISSEFRLLLVGVISSLVLLYTYVSYRTYPEKILKESQLRDFEQRKFPEQYGCIESRFRTHLPSITQPALKYQPLDPLQSAFTFGTRKKMFIGISGGLITKFRKDVNGFKRVILHELGHIANGDVEKAYLTAAAWQCLIYFLIFSLVIMISIYLYFAGYILSLGTSLGYDTLPLLRAMNPYLAVTVFGGYLVFFATLLALVYILRNQIIRVREFYADARVLEWEKSPNGLIQTLQECKGREFSRFEILTKFHPNIQERIQALRDNSGLFSPGLVVAFTIGYFFFYIEIFLTVMKSLIFALSSGELTSLQAGGYPIPEAADIGFRAVVAIFLFTFLMIAISSGFHKRVMRDIFIGGARYFSSATLKNIIIYSSVFSLGFCTFGLTTFLFSQASGSLLVENLIYVFRAWIMQTIYFSMVLFFLASVASMLIRRSFTPENAMRNFYLVTVFSSALFLIIRFIAIEAYDNKPLTVIIFLVFTLAAYVIIKRKDRELICPGCKTALQNPEEINLMCPDCGYKLFPWAVYPFSGNTPGGG